MSARLEIPFGGWIEQMRKLPEEMRGEAGAIVVARTDRAFDSIEVSYPEHTGNLRKQLRKSIEQTAFGVIGIIRNTARHAWLYENGSQVRTTKAGRNRGIMPPGKIFIPRMRIARAAMVDQLKDLLRRAGFEVSGG